jgi:O-antigen biosynthesis protein
MVFQIWAPAYRKDSVGVRALHQLSRELNNRGIPASAGLDMKPNGDMSIAVYPEVIEGNPFTARITVRWLLSNGGCAGSQTDLTFVWESCCNPVGSRYPVLWMPMVDEAIFRDRGLKRSGACIYARKYLIGGGRIRPEHKGLLNLASLPLGYWKVVAMMLQRSGKLISYERSMITTEALLCGCPVEFTQPELNENYNPENVIEDYRASKQRSPQMISDFIAACEGRAGVLSIKETEI